MKFEILSAKRSTCNESEAKDMAGCLAEGEERVICYFPTESAMRHASLFAAAPDLLKALIEMCGALEDTDSGAYQTLADARAAIDKAKG